MGRWYSLAWITTNSIYYVRFDVHWWVEVGIKIGDVISKVVPILKQRIGKASYSDLDTKRFL